MLLPKFPKLYTSFKLLQPLQFISNTINIFKLISGIKIESVIIKGNEFTTVSLPKNVLLNMHDIIILSENCTIQTNVNNNGKIYLNPYDTPSAHNKQKIDEFDKYKPITKPINFIKFSEL